MEILQNFGLLALIVVLYSQVGPSITNAPLLRRIGLGCTLGMTAVMTMSMPIEPSPGIIVDARSVPLALAGLFSGGIGTIIATAMAGLYRLLIGGDGVVPGILTIVLTASGSYALCWTLSHTGRPLRHAHLLGLAVLAVLITHAFYLVFLPTAVFMDLLRTTGLTVTAVTLVGVPVLGGLLLQDERRKALQAQLMRSEAQYRLLADHATDMITRFDMEFWRKYVSPASRRLFGYAPETLINERTIDRIHPDDLPVIESAKSAIRAGVERTTAEYRFRHAEGHWVWTEATLARSRDPGTGEIEIVSVARDITERKRVQEQLQEASLAKSRFLASMSHELRTPLNPVLGFAELIRDELHGPHSSPLYREYAIHIEEGGRHLLRLINDVLDLSKVEAGRMELVESPFDPAELIKDSVQLLRLRAQKKGVVLHSSVSDELESCRGDLHRLQQALLNLLSNAIKFSPEGGQVVVAGDLDAKGRIVISVRDTGGGISTADMAKLFQPFTQVGRLGVRGTEGTGLGLTLARDLVELHGGQVWLESEIGAGTTAFMTLPASRVDRRSRQQPPPNSSATGA